jgi:excisionase family DNA binding protein
METPTLEAALTVSEVARRFSISEEVVRRHARDGSLRGFQIGRRWRFEVAAVHDFVRQRTPDPSDEARTAP